jgi:hypothetical protein
VTAPQWDSTQQYYPPVLGPDPEWLAQVFLTPLLPETTVATKLPQPAAMQATLQNFMRVEAGDTVPVLEVFGTLYDTTFLMHSYSPDEVVASKNSGDAVAYASSVTGRTISGWYIQRVMSVIGGRRLSDPLVPSNIVRYRSAVTWRVVGHAPTKT